MGVGCFDLLIILETFSLTIIVSISLKNTVLCRELLLRVMLEQLYWISPSDTYNLEWTKYTNQLILDFGEKHWKTMISERSKMMRWALWCPQVSSWRYFLGFGAKKGSPMQTTMVSLNWRNIDQNLGRIGQLESVGLSGKKKKKLFRETSPQICKESWVFGKC